jgi:phosphoglycolate phosphatase
MQARVLLFDFDGTLADTFEIAVQVFNQLSGDFGYRPVTEEELPAMRKMGAREVMTEFGISTGTVPKLAHRGLKLIRARMDEVRPFAGIPEMLRSLKEAGFILGILTSNSEENVNLFLQRHDLELFDFVRSSSRLFGKAREIRGILKKGRWSKEEVIFIGDECRDIEASHKAGIRVAAVSWGFNTTEALLALEPAAVLHHPEEISLLLSKEP